MKVLLLMKFPLYGGGSGNYTRKLAQNLIKVKGYEVAIAAPDNRRFAGIKMYPIKLPFRAVFEGHPEWKGARRYSRLTPPQFIRIYTSFLKEIVRIVEDFQPDVIHINHACFLNWIAAIIKSFYGIAFVTTAHGTGIYLSSEDRRFRALTAQALEQSDQIIAVSPHTRHWLLETFSYRLARKTKVIPGGIDLMTFKPALDTSRIDKKYNLKDKKLVIFVGRLTKEKGLEYLLQAARGIKAEIFIIGSGPYRSYLQNYSKLLGLKNTHFLGYFGREYIDELREFYSRADAIVLPSVVDESLGLVILEAMISETPVVASNKGGIPLVVKNGKNGILVRSRSAKAIEKAINFIFDNPQKAEEMSKEARKIIEEKFSWQVLVPQVREIYKKAYGATKRLRDEKLARQIDKFQKEDLKREKEELQSKIGYIS